MAGRKVKLHDKEGEYGNSLESYKAPNGKYYSSQEAYEKLQSNEQDRMSCIKLMYEILDYQDFMKMPKFFYKKLKEWSPYGYDVILLSIKKKRKDIEFALRIKDFSTESGKIAYVCAIIESVMNDALKEKVKIKCDTSKHNLYIDDIVDLNINAAKQKTKDISRFLED